MSIRSIITGMSRLQMLRLQPFVRAASDLSESQKAVGNRARLAFKQMENGHLSISRGPDAIWTRIGPLEGTFKITLSSVAKEVMGASFLKISIDETDQATFPVTFAGICRAVGDSKGTDFITVDTRKLSEDQKGFLQKFLYCRKLNASEYLIPESTRNIIEAIWAKSSNS